jgi:hypothetical protein
VIIITGCVCGREGPYGCVCFVEEVDRQRRRLRALAADAAGELNVLGHDSNTLVGFGGVGCVVQGQGARFSTGSRVGFSGGGKRSGCSCWLG